MFNIVERPNMRPGYGGFGVDHISWLSTDIEGFVAHVEQTPYQFALKPIRYTQFGEQTVYRFGYLLNPDGLQTEIMQEDGRSGARSVFVNSDDLPDPPWSAVE